jgi:hypothetical protein
MNQYIDWVLRKIAALRIKYAGSGATVGGTIAEIYRTLDPTFRNEYQQMYKTVTKGKCCEACGRLIELQRCHAGKSRPEIAMEAIQATECCGPNGLRYVHDILFKFASLHENEPVKLMCQQCHHAFDHKPKSPVVKPGVPDTPTKKSKRSDPVPGRVNCRYRHLGCMSQLKNKNSLYTHVSRDCKFRPTSSGGGSVSPGAGRRTC